MASDRTDEQRRYDEEEERHYWDSIEDDHIADEEHKAAEKSLGRPDDGKLVSRAV